MSDDPPVRVMLHLDPEVEQDTIAGWLGREGEDPQRFDGWLQLLTLLRDLGPRSRAV